MAEIDGQIMEIRLRNVGLRAHLWNARARSCPSTDITIDIVGVGPVLGAVRWSQSGKLGVRFEDAFDLTRLAPKKDPASHVKMLRPWILTASKRPKSGNPRLVGG